MTDSSQLSTRDLERLSAYLDGELPAKEVEKLERRLNSEPDLRQALEQLRATVAILHELPEVKRPRSFVLTEAPRARSYPVLQFSTALAALAFIVVVGTDLLVRSAAQAPEQAMLFSQPAREPEIEEAGGLADADRSSDLPAAAELPPVDSEAVEREMEGDLQLESLPAAEPEVGMAEEAPAPAEEPVESLGDAAAEESETTDEFFKSDGREQDQAEAEAEEGVDLDQEEDRIVAPFAAGEAVESEDRERNLLLPALRIGEILLGVLLVILIGMTAWTRRR